MICTHWYLIKLEIYLQIIARFFLVRRHVSTKFECADIFYIIYMVATNLEFGIHAIFVLRTPILFRIYFSQADECQFVEPECADCIKRKKSPAYM